MDFALVWNSAAGSADWAIDTIARDILSDDGLKSAVIISLFTDRLAALDDVIPDGSADRRGWWGDMPVDGSAPTDDGDLIGSRLWLLSRAKAIPQTATRAVDYCLEALNWMILDGIAIDVAVTATWIAAGYLELKVAISRYSAANALETKKYDLVWTAALAA